MRLLHRPSGSDQFHMVERFGGDIPPYAILSHTWGSNENEVTFLQLQDPQAKSIPGYSKLIFCSEQATKDGLNFFWVDTCCIDKSSSTELTEALNSMFKWYKQAEKCYVLLSDVTVEGPVEDIAQIQWAQIFHSSRWFQRGWTLQELLAPKFVEFFSETGARLGDKFTLLEALHRRTKVPVPALQGCSLSQYSIDERMSWMEGRQTKREEDAAYSLLGLLGIHMSLLYGEGRETALARLRRKAERSQNGEASIKPCPPRPWTVPFPRNGAFIDRDYLAEVCHRCSHPAGSATLLGSPGVGKTQIAIEYAYLVRDQMPSRWVFWINAATRATFGESYCAIANVVKMKHYDNPKVDIMSLVRSWLCDDSKNREWTMLVDGADDRDVFFSHGPWHEYTPASSHLHWRLLSDFLPQVPKGSILVTSRGREVTQGLKDLLSSNAIIEITAMNTDEALASVGKQLGSLAYRDQALRLLDILDSTPLAVREAAAFINQRKMRRESSWRPDEARGSNFSHTSSIHEVREATAQTMVPKSGKAMADADPGLSTIVHRLHTAIEDLHDLLPAIRAVQPGHRVTNTALLNTSSLPAADQRKPILSNAQTSQTKSTDMPFTSKPTDIASIVAGTNGLMQLDLSMSDLALLIDQGRKIGNFAHARTTNRNRFQGGESDIDLFQHMDDRHDSFVRRPGLVDLNEMEKRWPSLRFVGHNGRIEKQPPDEALHTWDSFTWVMVAIVSALDECMPSSRLQDLLCRVFNTILDGHSDITDVLSIHLKRLVESWRSFGCTREIAFAIRQKMRKSWSDDPVGQASPGPVPQLNDAETQDAENMLVWLLNGDMSVCNVLSPITFSMAEAWREVKLDLCTDGNPLHESQACITYHPQGQLVGSQKVDLGLAANETRTEPYLISWPQDRPQSMIHSLGVGTPVENMMFRAWQCGSEAANNLTLIAKADAPYHAGMEVYYTLEVPVDARAPIQSAPHIGMLADQGFPTDSDQIQKTLEWILEGESTESLRWLQSHVANDYLLRKENSSAAIDQANDHRLRDDCRSSSSHKAHDTIFFKYQAFLLGFYYQLLKQVLSFELVESRSSFHSIWSTDCTTLLALCTQLGHYLRSDGRVSRAHIIYVLAAMYNGRRKMFNTCSAPHRLIGVLGSTSVLALPLIRATDDPKELGKIAVVDLPIRHQGVDNTEGDLMAGNGGGLRFKPWLNEYLWPQPTIQAAGPTENWSVHPYMSLAIDKSGISGVVMAARCGKRLVGWFNPVAADTSFLSSAYIKGSHSKEEVVAFEMKDENWQAGEALLPNTRSSMAAIGAVRSHKSPDLRYAATGFYAERGVELAIAQSANEFSGAFDRLQAQDGGMLIA